MAKAAVPPTLLLLLTVLAFLSALLPNVNGVSLQHRHRRASGYESALDRLFAPPPPARHGPAAVPIGWGLAVVPPGARHRRANVLLVSSSGDGVGVAQAAATDARPRALPPQERPSAAPSLSYVDPEEPSSAYSSSSSGDDTDASDLKRQAQLRVQQKASEAEALTNKLILGVKSIAAATASVAGKLMAGDGDDGIATATVDLRAELDELVQHEKLLSSTRNVMDEAVKDVAAAAAAAARAKNVRCRPSVRPSSARSLALVLPACPAARPFFVFRVCSPSK